MRTRIAAIAATVLLIPTVACADSGGPSPRGERAVASERVAPADRAALPGLRVEVIARGLDHPWEVQQLPSGHLLVTQRDRRALTLVNLSGGKRNLEFPSASVWASGETGLLGLEVDPNFTRNRRIYTCQGWHTAGGSHDVRVSAWTLDAGLTEATLVRHLVTGIPTSSGRHGGCRLLVLRNGSMLVGTGDAAIGTNPRNLDSLGGKVLRINRVTGAPAQGNPYINRSGKRRYVFTYGHRNVQGLAQRPDGSVWSVEHGSYRDDEINRLGGGHDYGWHPVPGYDESVPMTDQGLPGQQYNARWHSGDPTIAPSGADFVIGAAWGAYRNSLAVAVLKDQRLMFVQFDRSGARRWVRFPAALQSYGRLRDVTTSRQSLFVTTDNGGGEDLILRVRPR
ncbi:PQQ-dependent sugar dehydrogenase [Nocardioides caeni]|uniref:PQQ-dependent sugar dehydrogenase n=1 Tax=Nocardioides caeni TaxID=574700 RepID=A0A4S8NIW8_9ACTN|nr:PQQ-dependent sugar dehydrogenase [Nocardioides caeni]THV16081.1 PQQ-dependent sugar dehydrogenase [Nocardioides caeni]